MKRLQYSPDYTEKMRELKKYLDFQLGEDVRKKVIKEIGTRVRSLREHEQIGISVRDKNHISGDRRLLGRVSIGVTTFKVARPVCVCGCSANPGGTLGRFRISFIRKNTILRRDFFGKSRHFRISFV